MKPLPDAPAVTQSGWPELKLKPNPQQTTRSLTPEELEKQNWNQVQQRALKAASDFYSRNDGSDDEESDDDDDEDDDMEDEEDDDVKDKEYDFFWKMFNDDEDLKGYYVKHCGGGGEFSCLVCGGVNEKHLKRLKRFKDCIALVQHSSSIAKTKKIRSHRAYGQVICKVLEWDINRLPSQIVTDHKSSELQVGDVNGACHSGSNKIMDDVNGALNLVVDPNEKALVSETVDCESMVCEKSSVVANVEEETEASERGAVNNLCRNLSSRMVLEAGRK